MKKFSLEEFTIDLPNKVEKYLSKFSVLPSGIYLKEKRKFEMVVVVPAIKEYENIKTLISSFNSTDGKYHDKFLILFVINNSASASEEVKSENRKSFEFLKNMKNQTSLSYGIIDAFSHGNELNEKHAGVGLARKTGLDTALCLLDYSEENFPTLISLDADCTVSKNYFTDLYETIVKKKLNAGYVNFLHPIDNQPFAEAIIKYEISLRYYVLGLKFAQSPFAYFSIGSTMFSSWVAYVKIGGMNKRKAGEDFYFMEKLAKNYTINKIANVYVYPSPRTSWRVPFGTGKSVSEIQKGSNRYDFLYNPQIFEILKKWNSLFFSSKVLTSEKYLGEAKKINIGLYEFLVEKKFQQKWDKILFDNKNQLSLQKQKLFLFDSFATLKLIHYLQNNYFSNVKNIDAINFLFRKIKINQNCRNEIECLKLLRKQT